MISPTLSTLHDSNCPNILEVSFPGDDIIKDMPMFGPRVCLSNFVNFLQLKNDVANKEV